MPSSNEIIRLHSEFYNVIKSDLVPTIMIEVFSGIAYINWVIMSGRYFSDRDSKEDLSVTSKQRIMTFKML
jgi:hypothetical protein